MKYPRQLSTINFVYQVIVKKRGKPIPTPTSIIFTFGIVKERPL